MKRCACGHVEHDDGGGECFTSGCKCRKHVELKVGDEVLINVVGRIAAISDDAPMIEVAMPGWVNRVWRYPSEVTPFPGHASQDVGS